MRRVDSYLQAPRVPQSIKTPEASTVEGIECLDQPLCLSSLQRCQDGMHQLEDKHVFK